MRRLMVILAAAAALIAGAPPASASGGWALTYLDPVPSSLAPGTSYTIGFWVLQHGTHPFEGELGPTALRLTGADGLVREFPGSPLPEPGHYAAAVNVPEGVHKLTGVQGMFQPYEIGALTVPGRIEINPLDPELVKALREPTVDYWGVIRPPGIPDLEGVPDASPAPPTAASAPAATVPDSAPTAETPTVGVPPYTLLLAAAGGALLAVAALRLPRRGREPDPPVDDKADTIVISG
ncbi:hypothetical protein [Nonomuraea harbinensis]|uniref:Uncharacterized protein n=1 Tax=Nonomuraea harbinensis TaxID=1286938 RepID=A0ABW1BMC1_9ACTN|nr:hypothetical protein [Nonomuraea harbinensis]